MLSTAQIDFTVSALLAARAKGEPMLAPSFALKDPADAYRIQDAVAQRHGMIEGWKVGAKAPDATPTCAPLLRGTVRDRSTRTAREVYVRGPVGVELEIAYRLNRDFTVGSVVHNQDIAEAVASAHIAVELCASRLADGVSTPPLWLLADNQMNERLVVGDCIPLLGDPQVVAARVAVDEQPLVSTVGGHPVGDPFRLLVWLVRHCTAHRGGLRSGQIITTGSWTGMPIVRPPAQISGEFAELGSITFNISNN